MMVNVQSIIDKYNPDEDNTFSNDDVLNIGNEITASVRSSVFNNKLFVASCALVAIVSVVDRSFTRMSGAETIVGVSGLPPVRHLQEGIVSFSDWLECKAVATVPKSYVDTGAYEMGMTYVCEPTISCEEKVATSSPTVTATTASPTVEPTGVPTTSPTTSSPTVTPTTNPTTSPTAQPISESEGCFNSLNFGHKGDLEHSCEWVQRTDFRRDVLCTKQTTVRQGCPVSCGTCCGDNPDFLTDTPFGFQGCAWIGSNPLRKIGYCPVPDVGTYCAATCDKCGAYMSMVPTMFGTSNETSSPTGRLDDD